MNAPHPKLAGTTEAPVRLSVEPYISPEYAREEKPRLWNKVWQVACREEEIPGVGDFYTYDILDQSVIVVRSGEDEITAYHNACRHRGRKLTEGCGHARKFVCPYHGWAWNLDGENAHVLRRDHWDGALRNDALALRSVRVSCWAGFVFVNFDPESGPLEEYLGEVPYWLGVFEMQNMRYKWRQWLTMPCNWKVVTEAFIEGYHAPVTHPQTSGFGGGYVESSSEGLHGRLFTVGAAGGGIGTAVGEVRHIDVRTIPYLALKQQLETVWSNASQTFVDAAANLPDLLPETATAAEVAQKLMEVACRMDAERGVEWPKVDPQHMANVGINWHVFPNTILLPNVTYCLGFRLRPDGYNPDSCHMEIFALEKYPEGQIPETSWEYKPNIHDDSWPLLVKQDFSNLEAQQKGLHSDSLNGLLPDPRQEACVVNFQRNLAIYMGRPGPQPL